MIAGRVALPRIFRVVQARRGTPRAVICLMAKSKQPKRKETPSNPAHDNASRRRPAGGIPASEGRQSMFLPADPPQPNPVGLVFSLVLFVAWFIFLLYVALSSGG